eukprot:3186036-Alexandrium_andersonii.AAC.1
MCIRDSYRNRPEPFGTTPKDQMGTTKHNATHSPHRQKHCQSHCVDPTVTHTTIGKLRGRPLEEPSHKGCQ